MQNEDERQERFDKSMEAVRDAVYGCEKQLDRPGMFFDLLETERVRTLTNRVENQAGWLMDLRGQAERLRQKIRGLEKALAEARGKAPADGPDADRHKDNWYYKEYLKRLEQQVERQTVRLREMRKSKGRLHGKVELQREALRQLQEKVEDLKEGARIRAMPAHVTEEQRQVARDFIKHFPDSPPVRDEPRSDLPTIDSALEARAQRMADVAGSRQSVNLGPCTTLDPGGAVVAEVPPKKIPGLQASLPVESWELSFEGPYLKHGGQPGDTVWYRPGEEGYLDALANKISKHGDQFIVPLPDIVWSPKILRPSWHWGMLGIYFVGLVGGLCIGWMLGG